MDTTLKVSSKSNPNQVAGAIVGCLKDTLYSTVTIQAIGAGAVNQAVKAIAIARGFVAPTGANLMCIPAFVEIEVDGIERTAIRFIVKNV